MLRSAIGTLERLVSSLSEQQNRESFRGLRPLLDQPGFLVLATLYALLVPDESPAALAPLAVPGRDHSQPPRPDAGTS